MRFFVAMFSHETNTYTILEVAAPGRSSSNLKSFDFKNVRRPIFPVDDL